MNNKKLDWFLFVPLEERKLGHLKILEVEKEWCFGEYFWTDEECQKCTIMKSCRDFKRNLDYSRRIYIKAKLDGIPSKSTVKQWLIGDGIDPIEDDVDWMAEELLKKHIPKD